MSKVIAFEDFEKWPGARIYKDCKWLDATCRGPLDLTWLDKSSTYRDLNARINMFTNYYFDQTWMPGDIEKLK